MIKFTFLLVNALAKLYFLYCIPCIVGLSWGNIKSKCQRQPKIIKANATFNHNTKEPIAFVILSKLRQTLTKLQKNLLCLFHASQVSPYTTNTSPK